MLSTSETLTLVASIGESFLCFGYLLLLLMLSTTRLAVLKTPFYTIFVVTGVSSLLNLVAIITLRLFNQVFFFGPEFGQTCNWLSYFSHIFVAASTILKAVQVINRFTALFFPLKHDEIWSSSVLWLIIGTVHVIPAGIFSFMVIDKEALYSYTSTGILKYAGIQKSAQETAKILNTVFHGLFVVVTLPINIISLMRMRKLRVENKTLFIKERMYLYHVLVITLAHMVKGAHQMFWLYATMTENSSLNFIATYTYAFPNTITTFTPPIALILMSRQVRNGIRLFFSQPQTGSHAIDISHRVTAITPT